MLCETLVLDQFIFKQAFLLKLLAGKEKQRDEARKNWTSIENIKELKEGYLSQVVHKICQLAVEYDAIIAMEDLNSGFKNNRARVERSVYQKFENMLISKLQYLVDKKLSPHETGGALHAYQLSNKENVNGRQNGFIFYVPAYLTSKIDPTTGFVDLIHPKYASVDAAKEFLAKFDAVTYNAQEDLLEFVVDYSKLLGNSIAYKNNWVICTNGERIRSFRNKAKNSEWDTETVVLTEEFKKLFESYNINIGEDIKMQISERTEKDFFEQLIRLLALTLQMRNSIPNNTKVDYIISPVRNSDGVFYDSRNYEKLEYSPLPKNADANGAYNIARKAMWAIGNIKAAENEEELKGVRLAITKKEWLEMAQG